MAHHSLIEKELPGRFVSVGAAKPDNHFQTTTPIFFRHGKD